MKESFAKSIFQCAAYDDKGAAKHGKKEILWSCSAWEQNILVFIFSIAVYKYLMKDQCFFLSG